MFLDRDGVINRRIIDGYVTEWGEFVFLPGALSALRMLSERFVRIVVVTNQQGVARGIMSEDQVKDVHRRMISEVESAGGRIDRVYFSPYPEEEGNPFRKPSIGMALAARQDIPGIVFTRSVMVGDSLTDLHFGRNAGMATVFIDEKTEYPEGELADMVFDSLYGFAKFIESIYRM